MKRKEEAPANWPSFEEVIAKIVSCEKPSSVAVAVNNPRISEEEYELIHSLIGILSRNPIKGSKPCLKAPVIKIEDNS